MPDQAHQAGEKGWISTVAWSVHHAMDTGALGRMPQIQQQTNQWHVEAAIQG